MASLKVDVQAYSWLDKNVKSKCDSFSTLKKKELDNSKREIELWHGLHAKVSSQQKLDLQSYITLTLNRNELRAIERMVLEQMVLINGKTIPEYQERMNEYPVQNPLLKPYVEKLEALYMGLSDLMENIQGALK